MIATELQSAGKYNHLLLDFTRGAARALIEYYLKNIYT